MDWSRIFDSTMTNAIGVEACYFALAAIGLNMHFGYTGLLNFGQVGFMAMGAYGIGVSVTFFHWPLLVGVGVGLLLAVALALLLGVPTLRLRADYLAIVTIAASEIIRLFARSVRYEWLTGGSSGLTQFANEFDDANPFGACSAADRTCYGVGPIDFDANTLWVLVVGWTLVVLSSLFIFLLVRSPWGRVIRAIREDEDAVRSLGKNVVAYKMQSLVIGGVIGSLGGMIFAVANQSVQPDNYATQVTILAFAAVVLGGAGRVIGPVVGSMGLWGLIALTEGVAREAEGAGYIPDWIIAANEIGQIRFMLVGLGLALLMVLRPQGLFGNKRELAIDAR